ncbi:MAG TPA: HNH endonuclease [Caulobacteraceae bacterium]
MADFATGALSWRISRKGCRQGGPAGTQRKDGYWQLKIDRVACLRHHIIWAMQHGEWPAFQLDHRNRRRGEDWIDNLRPATDQQQRANQRARRPKSGFKGVELAARCVSKPWRARIMVDKRVIRLGYFATAEEASAAYASAAKEHFGEYAHPGDGV